MSKTLTKQWKDGTLEAGEYYFKLDGEINIGTDIGLDVFRTYADDDRINDIEVLEPVPTYEEYLGLLSDQLAKNEAEEINAELEAENKRLKEKLDISIKALEDIGFSLWDEMDYRYCAKKALKAIKKRGVK